MIIDDWHLARMQSVARRQLLRAAQNVFGKIIVFSDDASLLSQVSEGIGSNEGSQVEYCDIKPFGYRLRSRLIKNWHTAGPALEVDDLELTQRISTSEHIIDTLVGRGLLPSLPVFILSALQADASLTQDNAAYGSYGHIYEALLTKSMSEASRRKSSLGQKYTYLAIVAYHLFKTERSSLTEEELLTLHRKYENEYRATVDHVELWQELIKAHVLTVRAGQYEFQYKYAFYFFVAKYFQEGVGNAQDSSSLRAELEQMANCVHNDECSQILIFYIYLTKDRKTIEHILKLSARIFADVPPADLDEDVQFVNRLQAQTTDVYLNTRNIPENRNAYREELDAADTGGQLAIAEEKVTYSDQLPPGKKIEFAIKTQQVMGQVVKNFPLDLRGDLKFELTKQSYDLTLRVMRSFLTYLDTMSGQMQELFARFLRTYRPFANKAEPEIKDAAKTALINFAELGIFVMVKRLSLTIGDPDLRETFTEVREQVGEQNIPVRLIDLKIRLDHMGVVPVEDIRKLEQRLRRNWTAFMVLKLMVAEHLQLFPCGYQVEQQMTQLFKFKPEILRLGEKRVKKLKK